MGRGVMVHQETTHLVWRLHNLEISCWTKSYPLFCLVPKHVCNYNIYVGFNIHTKLHLALLFRIHFYIQHNFLRAHGWSNTAWVWKCIDWHCNKLDEVNYYLVCNGFLWNAPAPLFDHSDIFSIDTVMLIVITFIASLNASNFKSMRHVLTIKSPDLKIDNTFSNLLHDCLLIQPSKNSSLPILITLESETRKDSPFIKITSAANSLSHSFILIPWY